MPASGLHDWAMPPMPGAEACEGFESGWGVPSDVGHADPQMAELLREVGVPQVMHGDFLQFTVPEFGFVAADLAELNQFIDELVFPVDMPRALVTSKIRLLWSHCQKAVVVASPKVERESTVASDVSANQDAGWGQAFPKKLSVDQVRDMKAKFIARYPSEPLAVDTMPSPRLLALVHRQIVDKCWRPVPWKLRISEEQYESRIADRPHKAPKLEQLLEIDHHPQRDLAVQHMSRTVMAEILELHSTAIALCDGAHLHSLRDFNRRFLAKAFEKYGAESGLRPPTYREAMDADAKIWGSIASLVNDEGWTLESALREVVVVRNEIATLLMPRPAMPRVDRLAFLRKGLGKNKGNGKGKGKQPGPKGSAGKGLGLKINGFSIGTFYRKGQERRNLCVDFLKGACTRANCKFEHRCGVWMPDGNMCLQEHTPAQHKRTPH